MPRPKHFSRHIRQLKYLQKQCARWEENGYRPPHALLARLRLKLQSLLRRLASNVSKTVWLRPAICVALFLNLNLQEVLSQHFSDPVTSPFGLTNLTDGAMARTVDIDDDGDLDLFTFGYSNTSYTVEGMFHENIGTPDQPDFAAPTSTDIELGGLYYLFSDFGDLDDDGDYDMYGWIYYDDNSYDQIFAFFENTGTPEVAEFASPVLDTLPSKDLLSFGFVELADIDADGDLDLFVSSILETQEYYSVQLVYYENNGTPESHDFGTAVVNPFGYELPNPEDRSFHSLGDLDEDGDIDIIGWKYTYDEYQNYYQSKFVFYENSGTPEMPQFGTPVENPFNLPQEDTFSFPCLPELADWDDDGDLDLACVVTDETGAIMYFENTGTSSTSQSANAPPFIVTPNPASTFLQIGLSEDSDDFGIRIYDHLGRMILSRDGLNGSQHISCDHWPPGIYYLSVLRRETRWSEQISIQR